MAEWCRSPGAHPAAVGSRLAQIRLLPGGGNPESISLETEELQENASACKRNCTSEEAAPGVLPNLLTTGQALHRGNEHKFPVGCIS